MSCMFQSGCKFGGNLFGFLILRFHLGQRRSPRDELLGLKGLIDRLGAHWTLVVLFKEGMIMRQVLTFRCKPCDQLRGLGMLLLPLRHLLNHLPHLIFILDGRISLFVKARVCNDVIRNLGFE